MRRERFLTAALEAGFTEGQADFMWCFSTGEQTDAEVICGWMEPDAPPDGTGSDPLKKYSPKGWWRYSMISCCWKQPILVCCSPREKLGFLHEIESRLSHHQKNRYNIELYARAGVVDYLWHVSVEVKIAAIAVVLREDVK